MFTKILIANRGEIACRVITTARRMGIKTVALYSDPDRHARHVRMADEAVHIGAAASAQSYLRGDVIIKAALDTGAQAIHPGYGFLSENPDFVEAVEAAGLVFIGPSADSIRAMGLKDAAKTLMAKAGVPVVPGYQGAAQDVETLTKEAKAIGYPVLIKARAGGGGKGMRLVQSAAEFAEALAAAQREAQASFGDPKCLIEKYIQKPRHIEVQVFGDKHGNVVHIYERDCSLQRRHQKLVEEAPAPGMTTDMRDAMTNAAVMAAKAIDYRGAGTIEFIVDTAQGLRPDGFWFMEMNTRLQVEHPVSEAISGLDFVELQLRVAAGEALPVTQSDIPLNGHAIEVRLCAEDAARGFLPAIGGVDLMAHNADAEFCIAPLRLDSAVEAGDEITPHYDPMIGKLIAHGQDRDEARSCLVNGMDHLCLAPITTNIGFLRDLVTHTDFATGNVDTGLIEREYDTLIHDATPDPVTLAVAAIMALGFAKPTDDPFWQGLRNWRAYGMAQSYVDLITDDGEHSVSVASDGDTHLATVDGAALPVRLIQHEGTCLTFEIEGRRSSVQTVKLGQTVHIWQNSRHDRVNIRDHGSVEEGHSNSDHILAPMPGLLAKLYVAEGAEITKGQPVAMLEAMKMEHVLTAPRDGVIGKVNVQEGAQISDGMVLVALEPQDD